MALIEPGSDQWRLQAETDLIQLTRGDDTQNFTLTIVCREGHWTVTTVDHGARQTEPPSDTAIGEGDNFADAWHGQTPTWAK